MKKDSILFTPIKIGNVTIPNRFVRSATHDFMATPKGEVTDRQVSLFRKLAQGEVGLIITGHAYVHPSGKASPYQIGVDDDSRIEGLSRIAGAVHEYPSRVFLQIAHAGRQTKEKLCGCTPLAPSAVYEPVFKIEPKEMSITDIEEAEFSFIQAGKRALEAGFAGIQLHVAHGYLLSSFISPYTNRRTDLYGGSIANRARIVVETIQGIKTQVDKHFPIIVKLNATDSLKGGLSLEESIQTAKILEKEGVDGIEVSGGMAESGEGSIWEGLRSEEDEGYFVGYAARVKKEVRVPVFGLGGIRTLSNMERIIQEGRADMISMSRPFIRQPFLVREFRLGRFHKSECISCNKCLNPRGIACGDLKTKKTRIKD
jgi:2,4-dienoyl-CoA reductase-like NADH-dependent reductase (Old Yellow Enzyme family)